jgi:hypothetical protein
MARCRTNTQILQENILRKKILTYLIVAIAIFLLILFAGVLFINFTWSESALLSAFLTAIGVGGYW